MKLFEPGKIGSMTIKNRVVMTPMAVPADPDGGFSEDNKRYYAERARGGVGLIITGYSAENTKYESTSCTVLDSFDKVPRLMKTVSACHAYGAKVCVQLGPGLGRIFFDKPGVRPVSASDDVPSYWEEGLTCRALTVAEIRVMVADVAQEALIAKKAGADAVELRVYGSYLADQFMSELWNHRTDQYGGSFENRMRFMVEMVEAIQQSCGKDYPLIVKYNPYHGIEGGREIPEGQQIGRLLEGMGVHGLHLDKGCYEKWYTAISTVYETHGHQLDMAAEVRKVVSIPVISQGKLDDPAVAERALAEGKTDFVGIGHGLLSDPHWANKVQSGKVRDVVPCIGCNECLRRFFAGQTIECAVNPWLHREGDNLLDPVVSPKRILVVGGGPAGLQAALTAQSRGHQVTVWEKGTRLGGLLWAAGGPSFKRDVARYAEYLVHQVDGSSIDVRLMTEATPESVLAGGFDQVVVATGSDSFVPRIPGIDGDNVYLSTPVLTNDVVPDGSRTAVLGGGLVGCETAMHLADKGKTVTIIEMLDDILATTNDSLNNEQSLRNQIAERGIEVRSATRLDSVADGQITISVGEGSETLPCDSVVVASGYRSDKGLAEALAGRIPVTVIGDNVAPRKIFDAVHEGFDIGRTA